MGDHNHQVNLEVQKTIADPRILLQISNFQPCKQDQYRQFGSFYYGRNRANLWTADADADSIPAFPKEQRISISNYLNPGAFWGVLETGGRFQSLPPPSVAPDNESTDRDGKFNRNLQTKRRNKKMNGPSSTYSENISRSESRIFDNQQNDLLLNFKSCYLSNTNFSTIFDGKEESTMAIALQVSIPLILSGLGMVGTGILLDMFTVKFLNCFQ